MQQCRHCTVLPHPVTIVDANPPSLCLSTSLYNAILKVIWSQLSKESSRNAWGFVVARWMFFSVCTLGSCLASHAGDGRKARRTHWELSTGEAAWVSGHLYDSVGKLKWIDHPCVRTTVNTDTEVPLWKSLRNQNFQMWKCAFLCT